MEIKGIGAFAPSVSPSGKPASSSPAAETPVKGDLPVSSPVRSGAPEGRPRVRARDLLSDDEQRYLESLFPGATDPGNAAETYAGKGRQGSVLPGTLVDRKG